MKPSLFKQLDNFQNINELLDLNVDNDKLAKMVRLIDLESAEFYKTIILYQNGRPVASGCINVTQVPITYKNDDSDKIDLNFDTLIKTTVYDVLEQKKKKEMENPFENFRCVIQYIMLDKDHLDSD